MDADRTRRLRPQEAALELGISTEAVRQRVRRGTLRAEKAADGHVYVHLDATEHRPHVDTTNEQALIIERLDSEVAFLRRELENRTEEIRRRDTIIAQLTQRIPELPAREPSPSDTPETTGRPETSGEGSEASGGTQTPPEPQPSPERLSWWRRMFGQRS